jgi:hypothetical protein
MVIKAFDAPLGQVRGLKLHTHRVKGIPETDLWRWQDMIREDPDWRPWSTHHDRHRPIFSPLEERSIVSFIRPNFIEPGLIFTDSDFRKTAINVFL